MSLENYVVDPGVDEVLAGDKLLSTTRVIMQVMAERYEQEVSKPLEASWSNLCNALQHWRPNDVVLSAAGHAHVHWRFQYLDNDDAEQTFGIVSNVALPATNEGDELKVAIRQLNDPMFSKTPLQPLHLLGVNSCKDKVTDKYGFVFAELSCRLGESLPRHMNKAEVGGSAMEAVTIKMLDAHDYLYDNNTMISYSRSGYLRNGSGLATYEATWLVEDDVTTQSLIYRSFEERFISQSIKEASLPTLNVILAILEQETTVPCLD